MSASDLPLLNSRAAIRCARRTHNDHDPSLDDSHWVEVEATRWTEFGIAFEIEVRARLRHVLGAQCVDLTDLRHADATTAATAAMNDGVRVIIGGALPDDIAGGRRGRPDLLTSTGTRSDGATGYLPADIKSHRVAKESTRGSAATSPLAQLGSGAPTVTVPGLAPNTGNRLTDLLQLSHYWRMLQACGHESHLGPTAGLIGTDSFAGDDPYVLWQQLDEPVFTTYSRSRGTTKRSALERYDHEFEFRSRIAKTAQAQDEPLVRPIIIEACDSCPWHDVCLELVGELEPSQYITSGRLGVREWNALHDRDIRTLQELATLSISDPRLDDYWSELDIAESKARTRLYDAIVRAQMMITGEKLRRINADPIVMPRADVEVDFDIEWDTDGRIYLWGLLITDADGTVADSIVSWDELDDVAEDALAVHAIGRLMQLRDVAHTRGQSFAVYHYSHPEVSMVSSLLERRGADLPSVNEWQSFTDEHFVDLLPIVKRHFIGVKGLGLKHVAPWAGFEWEDEDPSGEQSMVWIDESRHSAEADDRQKSRDRLLQYNTDDVRATLAVRRKLAEET